MIVITTNKKLKEKMQEAYSDGYRDGAVAGGIRASVSKTDPCRLCHTVILELKELDKNTWDHDRVEKIRKILIQGLNNANVRN